MCLASLKALTSPPPTAICIFIHLQGQLRCSSPHSTIALPLLNIYGSQETRSQHQLFYSHTFFFFSLIASAPAFTTLSFMASSGGGGGYLRLLQSFFLLIRQEEALVGLQVKPQCHPVATAGNCSQHNY